MPAKEAIVPNANVQRVCNMAGLDIARARQIELQQLKATLEQSLRELQAAQSSEQRAQSILLALQLTRATSIAFINLTAEALSAIGDYIPALKGSSALAKLVKSVAGMGMATADAAGAAMAGEKVDWVKTASRIGNSATGLVSENALGLGKGTAEYLAKSATVKAELVRGAIADDEKAVTKAAIKYNTDLMKQIGKEIADTSTSAGGNPIGGKLIKSGASAINITVEAATFSTELDAAFSGDLSAREEMDARHASLKTMLLRQMRRLQGRIDELEREIGLCQTELPKASPTPRISPLG